jgi:hypothetical protein
LGDVPLNLEQQRHLYIQIMAFGPFAATLN